MRRKRSPFKYFLFSAAGVLLVLSAMEIFLRLIDFRHEGFYDCPSWWTRCKSGVVFQGDPQLFWRLRPLANQDMDLTNPDTQAVNSLGFRDDEFPVEKPAGEFRIISMGDSCTFGDGVANWESYPNVLEAMIKKADPEKNVRVINAGVPGYTSYQILAYLKNELLKYKPDLVTIYVGFNDNIPASHGIPDKNIVSAGQFADSIKNFLRPLRIYQLTNRFISQIKYKKFLPDPTPFPQDGNIHESRVSLSDFIMNLCEINELGKAHGFKVLLMTLPHSFDKEPDSNQAIREASQKCSVPWLDLWEAMKVNQKSADLILYHSDGGHPNVLGHRVIAAMVFTKLQSMGILKEGPIPQLPTMRTIQTTPQKQPDSSTTGF